MDCEMITLYTMMEGNEEGDKIIEYFQNLIKENEELKNEIDEIIKYHNNGNNSHKKLFCDKDGKHGTFMPTICGIGEALKTMKCNWNQAKEEIEKLKKENEELKEENEEKEECYTIEEINEMIGEATGYEWNDMEDIENAQYKFEDLHNEIGELKKENEELKKENEEGKSLCDYFEKLNKENYEAKVDFRERLIKRKVYIAKLEEEIEDLHNEIEELKNPVLNRDIRCGNFDIKVNMNYMYEYLRSYYEEKVEIDKIEKIEIAYKLMAEEIDGLINTFIEKPQSSLIGEYLDENILGEVIPKLISDELLPELEDE